jgi:hypothetical protein
MSSEQDVPLDGCFCFVNPDGQAGGSDIPLVRTLSIAGFPLLYPRKLYRRLGADGLRPGRIAVLTKALVERFPAA